MLTRRRPALCPQRIDTCPLLGRQSVERLLFSPLPHAEIIVDPAIIAATMAAFPHPARPDPPHSGVVRTIYFLAVAAAAIFVAITAVVGFYDPPAGDTAFPSGFEESSIASDSQQEREDYNRNVTLILSAISAAVFAAAILGLGSRFNPLRAGLILGGLIIFLVAMGFWASSSDKWIGFLMTLVNLGALIGSSIGLEEGLPMRPREPARRLQPADIAPSPASPPPPADFEPASPPAQPADPPPSPPTQPAEPPPSRTEPPPPMSDLPRAALSYLVP